MTAGGRKTLLFIDEIHRFNKAQQDVLLPDVEDGVVTLVGATTANPFFAVNTHWSAAATFPVRAAVAGRHQEVAARALADQQRGLGQHDVHWTTTRWIFWPKFATATPAEP